MTANASARAIALVGAAAAALKERSAEVDRLNVFPVPDGDTGTNMSLTMDAVMTELANLGPNASRSEVCHAITHGSLMGARGNSGVILSQILRGLCEVVGAGGSIDPALVASALDKASHVAYQAVRKPVEGTMLTVVKDAAAAAESTAKAGVSLEAMLETVVDAAYESVRRGPDLLPVLKENGVVDAGGFGVAILCEGFVSALGGAALKRADAVAAASPAIAVHPVDDWEDDEFLYCTEFLLHGTDLDADAVGEWVATHGGSELVVGGGDTLKIHVHTDDPAAVLAKATTVGEVSQVHINNMRRQTAERSKGLQAETAPAKAVGVVAVAAGAGLADILTSLGVDVVVNGGQTMNPSTGDLVSACKQVDAASVIILPNNKNIVMAAQQVPGLSERPVAVVPTRSVPQGFAAMLEYDPDGDLDSLVGPMSEAAARVKTGEVTVAVKDAKAEVGDIRAGQVIGIIDDTTIDVVGDDVLDVAKRLALMIAEGAESLTLLAGQDLSDEDLASIAAAVAAEDDHVEIETLRGEQPLYPVLMSAE